MIKLPVDNNEKELIVRLLKANGHESLSIRMAKFFKLKATTTKIDDSKFFPLYYDGEKQSKSFSQKRNIAGIGTGNNKQ